MEGTKKRYVYTRKELRGNAKEGDVSKRRVKEEGKERKKEEERKEESRSSSAQGNKEEVDERVQCTIAPFHLLAKNMAAQV